MKNIPTSLWPNISAILRSVNYFHFAKMMIMKNNENISAKYQYIYHISQYVSSLVACISKYYRVRSKHGFLWFMVIHPTMGILKKMHTGWLCPYGLMNARPDGAHVEWWWLATSALRRCCGPGSAGSEIVEMR